MSRRKKPSQSVVVSPCSFQCQSIFGGTIAVKLLNSSTPNAHFISIYIYIKYILIFNFNYILYYIIFIHHLLMTSISKSIRVYPNICPVARHSLAPRTRDGRLRRLARNHGKEATLLQQQPQRLVETHRCGDGRLMSRMSREAVSLKNMEE